MDKAVFSVSDVAKILDLHPKTVQRFIREGRLKGVKIGRCWKINRDSLKEFTHSELTEDGWNRTVKKVENVPDSPVSERVTVSSVIELRQAGSEESSRITNTLMAVMNGKEQSWGKSRYDYIYDPETGTARFILYGSPCFISSILRLLEPLLAEDC